MRDLTVGGNGIVKWKICTFNVNSIRARKDLLTKWLEHRANDVDVLCFQETKTIDTAFPSSDFETLGYVCEAYGQKSYNGMAVCSRTPLQSVTKGFRDDYLDKQKRLITVEAQDISIINAYAPHGDTRGSKKYHYKLYWFNEFLNYLDKRYSPKDKVIVVGDLNVARHAVDVYDAEAVKDAIGTMSEEREAFEALLHWGLIDTFRHLYPSKQQFTWWDYIGGAIWKNQGMRIDYALCTGPLIEKIKDAEVDLWPRRRRTPKPSDHAPVIISLE